MKRFSYLALMPLVLAATPATATVTFDGLSYYAGTRTPIENIYSAHIFQSTLGNYSLTNNNGTLLNLGNSNTAFVETLMGVATSATGSRFLLDGRAQASWTGFPANLAPGADSDNQFRYYFTLDAPFQLEMSYEITTVYSYSSDYFETYGGFDGLHVTGGHAADRSDAGSLFQYNAYLRASDPVKTISLQLAPGVYTLSLNGGFSAKTYRPGGVSAIGLSGLFTNLNPVTGVPEPANWALLIAGFGLTGAALRRRRYQGSVLPV